MSEPHAATKTELRLSGWLYACAFIAVAALVWKVSQVSEKAAENQQRINDQVELLSATVTPRIAVDRNMVIRRASDSALSLFNASNSNEFLGTHLSDYMVKPMPEMAAEAFGKYQETGELPRPIEWILKTTDDRNVYVRMTAEEHLFRETTDLFGMQLKVIGSPPGVTDDEETD